MARPRRDLESGTTLAPGIPHGVALYVRAARNGSVQFYQSDSWTFAASIAYYSLLSFFPFLLLVLWGLSRLALRQADIALAAIVATLLPTHFDFVMTQLHELGTAPVQLSVLGLVVLIWASMGVFNAITSAVNYAWGVTKLPGFWEQRLIALLMLAVSSVLLVSALFAISGFHVLYAGTLGTVLSQYPGLAWVGGFVARQSPTPLFIVVVGLVYYFIPNTKVRLRDVWFGAIFAGILWRIAFVVFAWYVSDFSRLSVVHGSIAAVVAFLVWVYVSAVILLFGAEVSTAYAKLCQGC